MSAPLSPDFLSELKTLLLDAADQDELADGLCTANLQSTQL